MTKKKAKAEASALAMDPAVRRRYVLYLRAFALARTGGVVEIEGSSALEDALAVSLGAEHGRNAAWPLYPPSTLANLIAAASVA